MRVSENRVLGSIFGPKREEGTEGWGKLHNEELSLVFIHSSMPLQPFVGP
jgi:hypothetical protein